MGIKCLLISTNQVKEPYPVYPLGIAHLMGALEKAGHKSEHFDLLAQGGTEALADFLQNSSYDLICISIRNIDTMDYNSPQPLLKETRKSMEIIRTLTKAPVVVGGAAFSIMPEEIMQLVKADCGVIGEGEKSLVQLADKMKKGENIEKGIIRPDPEKYPWSRTVYQKKNVNYYLQYGGMLNIQTKRGCPHQCTYCSYPNLEGKKYRFRDPEEVAEEFLRIRREQGADYIFFSDSTFNDNREHYLEIAEALIRKGNTTPWCAFFRPENLTSSGLALMKRAGLAAMEMGTDAASDRTMAGLNKGFTFQEVLANHELTVSLDIPCAHFIIFGGPGEDGDTLEEGLANLEKLRRTVIFAIAGIRILPDTGIKTRAEAEGIIEKNQSLLAPVFYFSPAISHQEIDQRLKKDWQNRFDRVYPFMVMQQRINHLHKKGYKGPIWDYLKV
ncbi:MAG: lipid biosynthesis B12-binding/radical SAM protein [Thermodesulfobacteriota bacterium]